jgi:hypothetical protein
MKPWIRSSMAALLPIATMACEAQTSMAPFNVVVRGPPSSCTIEVEGREVSTDELLAIARPEAKNGRRPRIESDRAEIPYRCVGGAIYALQMAGFGVVPVTSQSWPSAGPVSKMN